MQTGASKGLENEINVTPMIDVLLVLLIIFMAALPNMRKAIDIQLPDPNPQQAVANPNADQLSVAARNQFAPLVTFVTAPPDSLPLLAARMTSELYLCQHGRCQLPARSIDQLREQLSALHEGSRSL